MSNSNQKRKVSREYNGQIVYTGYNEADDGRSITQFTEDQVKELNNYCIRNYDKWNRMLRGLASSILEYRNNILHLEIDNTETKVDSSKDLCYDFLDKWIGHIKRYSNLKPVGYVIYLYKTNRSTGFVIDNNISQEEKSKLIAAFNAAEIKELKYIVSGLLNRSES